MPVININNATKRTSKPEASHESSICGLQKEGYVREESPKQLKASSTRHQNKVNGRIRGDVDLKMRGRLESRETVVVGVVDPRVLLVCRIDAAEPPPKSVASWFGRSQGVL